MHGPIVSPYTGKQQPKVMYLSTKTPFMSAFKHVKQLLKHVEKRETERDLSKARKNVKHGSAGKKFSAEADDDTESVYIKATGKAIDKALQLALFLQQQQDLIVKIKTGSASAIDDLVVKHESRDAPSAGMETYRMGTEDGHVAKDAPSSTDDIPEARIRQASTMEIEVSLRR